MAYSYLRVPVLRRRPIDRFAEENPYVENVPREFKAIDTGGDFLAVYDGGLIPDGRYMEAMAAHYRLTHFQGIQRTRIGKHLIISGGDANYKHSQLFVVRMASRKTRGGWKSNLLTGTFNKRDRIVGIIKVDATKWHAGGMSVCGDILAVPVYSTENVVSSVALFLVKDPESPKRIDPTLDVSRRNEKAGAVALTRLPGSGRFLMAVWSDSDNLPRRLDFYLSKTDDIFDGFIKKKQLTWDADPRNAVVSMGNGDGSFNNYQSTNFVVQKKGGDYKLFLVGTYNTVALALGQDYAELFELEFEGNIFGPSPSLGSIVVTKRARRKFPNDMNFQFNFAAAGGIYVDPRGTLRLYSTYYWKYNGILRFNEFRKMPDPVDEVISDINHSWVELFEHNSFKGRRLSLRDIRDGDFDDYHELYVQGDPFPSKISSAMFQIPAGERYRLFQRPGRKGRSIDLVGTGEVVQVPDFKRIGLGNGVTSIHKDFKDKNRVNFGDEVMSSRKV